MTDDLLAKLILICPTPGEMLNYWIGKINGYYSPEGEKAIEMFLKISYLNEDEFNKLMSTVDRPDNKISWDELFR